MIFKETLIRLQPEVDAALDEIFAAANSNQTHEQDMLLIYINGFYEKSLENSNPKLSPFVFGPGGWGAHAYITQFRFYDSFRKSIISESREDYFKDYTNNLQKQAANDFLIQIELMVYLKFWESDRTLKELYGLSALAQGKDYDWFFEITREDSRQEIIREKIRNPIKELCPKYYNLLKNIYLSQIRNAVAHSQYYILGTNIGFANADIKKHAPLGHIKFEEWEDRFHKLILMYEGLLKRFNQKNREYIERQKGSEFGLDIRVTEKDGVAKISWIKYVLAGRLDWMWYETWRKHYKYRDQE